MNIAVIDGQGGGIGKAIIEKLRQRIDNNIDSEDIIITAAATNSYACEIMKKAGADESFYGLRHIEKCCKKADIIAGAIGIIASGSMMGEITPEIAQAVSECGKRKILIPINKCNYMVAGLKEGNLSEYIND
ncbi:MAG TPA: hypothetical protein DCP97_04015, partial [Ruminococcaceae bacterium]|nr:hypothetical protein [Oscillospiraceae bacterium]